MVKAMLLKVQMHTRFCEIKTLKFLKSLIKVSCFIRPKPNIQSPKRSIKCLCPSMTCSAQLTSSNSYSFFPTSYH